MEIVTLGAIVLVFWTSEVLFSKPVRMYRPKKNKSKEEKLADALKDYLESLGKDA